MAYHPFDLSFAERIALLHDAGWVTVEDVRRAASLIVAYEKRHGPCAVGYAMMPNAGAWGGVNVYRSAYP